VFQPLGEVLAEMLVFRAWVWQRVSGGDKMCEAAQELHHQAAVDLPQDGNIGEKRQHKDLGALVCSNPVFAGYEVRMGGMDEGVKGNSVGIELKIREITEEAGTGRKPNIQRPTSNVEP
jgi:hypothetical protein